MDRGKVEKIVEQLRERRGAWQRAFRLAPRFGHVYTAPDGAAYWVPDPDFLTILRAMEPGLGVSP